MRLVGIVSSGILGLFLTQFPAQLCNSPTVQFDVTSTHSPLRPQNSQWRCFPRKNKHTKDLLQTSPFPPWWIYSWLQRLQRKTFMPVRLHMSLLFPVLGELLGCVSGYAYAYSCVTSGDQALKL